MKLIKQLLWLVTLTAILFAISLGYYARTSLHLQPSSQDVVIEPKSSLRSVAYQLVKQGVITEPWRFIILARVLHKETYLQAGSYTLNKNVTPYQLLVSLNHGKSMQGGITFIEGRTFSQMREHLANNEALKHTINSLSDKEVLALIGATETHPEGLFFPDTYYFDRNTEDIVILKKAYDAMHSKLEKAWVEKANKGVNGASSLPYERSYEALIMASIIEKETGKASERPQIAGVFLNRLRFGMRLQTDPTVIYGLGDHFDGNLRRNDLTTDTVYNTYTRAGLPPTPIAMPGLAAIEAALHPASTNALYFVGKGDGSHAFSATLVEHNRAVVKYQLKAKAKH